MNDSPFAESPYDDADALMLANDPFVRRPVDNSLYARLKRNEPIHVLAERTGLRFFIVPERFSGVVCAYTAKYEDGTISPDHNRIMFADVDVRDWCEHLVEIEE